MKNLRSALALFILISHFGTSTSHAMNHSIMNDMPQDLLRDLFKTWISDLDRPQDLVNLDTALCNHTARSRRIVAELNNSNFKQCSVSRNLIHRLIGNRVHLEPGAFQFNQTYEFHDPDLRIMTVELPYSIAENDVTQEQYDLIAFHTAELPTAAQAMNPYGHTPNYVDPKKPIGGLRESERQLYLERLNQALAIHYPVAYPGQPVPFARLPTEAELRYAMTEPLPARHYTRLRTGTLITARLRSFSGTDVRTSRPLSLEDLEELRTYVVCQRNEHEGPQAIDVEPRLPNQRGLKDLTGNISKPTSSPHPIFPNDLSTRVSVGGSWYMQPQNCEADKLTTFNLLEANPEIGLRLVFDFR